jgi:hypothetical protein
MNNAVAQPDLREKLVAAGIEVELMSSKQAQEFIRNEAVTYQDVIKDEFCSRFGYGGCAGYVYQ